MGNDLPNESRDALRNLLEAHGLADVLHGCAWWCEGAAKVLEAERIRLSAESSEPEKMWSRLAGSVRETARNAAHIRRQTDRLTPKL